MKGRLRGLQEEQRRLSVRAAGGGAGGAGSGEDDDDDDDDDDTEEVGVEERAAAAAAVEAMGPEVTVKCLQRESRRPGALWSELLPRGSLAALSRLSNGSLTAL